MEDLRQNCISVEVSEEDAKSGAKNFFEYITTVHELCPTWITRKCHELGVTKAKLNQGYID